MENLSPAAMTALAGAAAIAAGTASLKNLYGLGTASGMTGLGAGISGFLVGLSIGEIGLSWVGNDYSAVGGALASFSEAIGNLTTGAVTLFAGVAAIAIANQAFGGDAKSLAKNMTGVAAGIAGFLGGLVLTDIGLDWITGISGADGSGLSTVFKMFSDSVGSLSPESLLVLGGLAAVATKFDADPKRTAKNMFGVSAGIAGFLGGLVLTDIGLDWITGISGTDGSDLNGAFKLFNDSVTGLSVESVAILGGLLGIASKFTINPATIAKNMFGISAGIAGFLGGLVLADKGLSWLDGIPSGSGEGLVSAFKMFNDIILSLSTEAMTALGVLMAVAATGVGGATIAVGLPLIGVGIAGFMSALAVGDGITQLIAMGTGGEPGAGLKALFTNVFQGVAAAKELDGIDLVGLGAGLISVSAGLAAFGVGSIISGLGQAGAAIIAFFTGESAFDQIMKIADNADGLVKGGEALEKITSALSKFADIKISGINLDFKQLAIDLGRAIPFLDALAHGGPVEGSGSWWGEDINFPKGLLNPSLQLDEMADAIAKVNFVLGKSNVNPNVQQSAASATAESNLTGAQGNIPMDGAIRETSTRIQQEQERSARLEAEIERRTAASAQAAASINAPTYAPTDARAATYVGGPTYINNMSNSDSELSFGSAM
jgi:hypothetical protein